ncbi:hydroxymethylglutaryl-CoA synthase family protein [Polyangium mundeleinium]|uniref:Hydroxymethylglutaryl-CoA synthase n=1 Tax=Polyangium mundeleinium TaxID=2995306 RepID=A0ABT5EUB9_9BACT|nr:hydroxymethylglutaryl-CoA synthase [Polyangium mundeleinium]MDC0744937.1 hydroxymethylglutaryl-CoA synthase [Polyangium mundeleinium]
MNAWKNVPDVGIDAMALSVPRGYVDLAELAEARGVPPSKYLSGLGTRQMTIAAPDEDPVTLAVNAARRLFERSGANPAEIGLCIVGTETAVDHSKPVAAFVHGLLGLPSACRMFEAKHACFGGTAGLLSAVDWIASGSARGRAALVVCTDIARYPLRSAGEPTQGAGAVALLVREKPRLLSLEVGQTGTFARDVHDFWRPLHHKEALVDGHYSVQCYLDALEGAYDAWRRLDGAADEPLVRTCYHVPYGKMARKAHRHRRMLEGATEQAADASFGVEVEPSLDLPSRIGNVYTGSLYLALASLLNAQAREIAGKRIGLFSYGSGCCAEFFAGRTTPEAAALVDRLDIDGPLRDSQRMTVAEYERLRAEDAAADRRTAPESARPRGKANEWDRAVYLGVDSNERRVYAYA